MSLKSPRAWMVAATAALAVAAWAKSPAQWQALIAPVKVSLEQAMEAATKAVPGTVIDVELDDGKRGSGVRYEAKILSADGNRSEVWVDAATGAATLHKQERAKTKDVERAKAAQLDMVKAIQAATAHTAGQVVSAELDDDKGTLTYKVDVLQADHTVMEIKLNAADGQVIRAKLDD